MNRKTAESAPLQKNELAVLDAWWRAANYLSVGQIYLRDNPLLEKPLRLEHIKPRLLGHFGTTPGLNLIYAHLNGSSAPATSTACTSPAPVTGRQPCWPTPGWRALTASSTLTSPRTRWA